MFVTRTKKNMVTRNGVHARPAGPMVCRMMSLRTNSMPISTTLWTPVGTSRPEAARRPATQNSTKTMRAPSHMRRTTLFTSKGVPLNRRPFHSTSSEMGGKWRAPRTELMNVLPRAWSAWA
jgi:hypothetical protein